MIRFSWGTGSICVDPEVLIREMTMANYRKWLKLFIRYGDREDHIRMIRCLCDSLIAIHTTIKGLEAELDWMEEYNFPTISFAEKRRVARIQLRTAKRQRERIIKMWDLLGGRLT